MCTQNVCLKRKINSNGNLQKNYLILDWVFNSSSMRFSKNLSELLQFTYFVIRLCHFTNLYTLRCRMEIGAVSGMDYSDVDDLGETKSACIEKSHSTPFWEKLFFQNGEKSLSGRTIEAKRMMSKVSIRDAEVNGKVMVGPDGKPYGNLEFSFKFGPEDKNESSNAPKECDPPDSLDRDFDKDCDRKGN